MTYTYYLPRYYSTMNFFPFTWQEVKQQEKKPVVIFLVSIGCLVAIRFLASSAFLLSIGIFFRKFGWDQFYETIEHYLSQGAHQHFWQLVYWASFTILFYCIVPALFIVFVWKQRLADFGLKAKNKFGYWLTYLLAFACLFPIVLVASYSSEFQITYPFYLPLDAKDLIPYFIVWECFYLLQFFALEFFFRGFMVHGLKRYIGAYSILVMMIPYCMIHFNKPLPECVGSIFAGIFLGMMSYKTGSVWMGAFTHMAVAISMDVLSLWHRGVIFNFP